MIIIGKVFLILNLLNCVLLSRQKQQKISSSSLSKENTEQPVSSSTNPKHPREQHPKERQNKVASQSQFSEGAFDSAVAEKFARRALENSGSRSQSKCWLYVNNAITGKNGQRMEMSALDFFKSVSHSKKKSVFGLCVLKREDGTNETRLSAAPIGSVIGYAPKFQGFHATYGHGEIKVSESKYCSDYCDEREGSFNASFILYPCAVGSAILN